jgi:SnoaL-like protein
MSDVATAPSALQRLEIREACERLALDYSFFADSQRMDDWSELFADDGELVLFGQTYRGPAAIRAAVGGGRGAAALSVHAITNQRIDIVSETAATATVYIIVYAGERKDGGPASAAKIAPAMVGIYHDAYRWTPAGWKFARRAFEPLVTTAQS